MNRFGTRTSTIITVFRFFCIIVLATLVQATSGFGQTTDANVPPEILLRRLSSSSFRVREEATLALWQLGDSVRPQLEAHQDDSDAETRQRIKYVLGMLELGLAPETPANVRQWIQEVQVGRGKSAQQAVTELLKADRLNAIRAVVKNAEIKDGQQQRVLTNVLTAFRSTQSDNKYDDFFMHLLQTISAQPNEDTRDLLLSQLLGVPRVSQGLSEEKWVLALTDLLVKDKSAKVKRRLIGRVYSSSGTIGILIKKDRLHHWIDAIAESQDKSRQSMYLRQIVSSSTIKEYLSKDQTIAKLIDKLSVEGKEMLLTQMTSNYSLHEELFKQIGDQDLQQMYDGIADQAVSRKLLGRLIGMPFWYDSQEHKQQATKLLARDQTTEERSALIAGILEGWQQIGSSKRKIVDQEFVSEIWALLTEEPADWQLRSILMCYGLPDLFKDRFTSETIDQLMNAQPGMDKQTGIAFAQAPTRYTTLIKQLQEEDRVLEFMECIRKASPQTWQSYASSLYRSDQVVGSLEKPEQRERVLEILAEETETVRYSHLIGLFDNKKMLPVLIKDKKYDELLKLIPGPKLSYQRAQLLGRLLSKPDVVDYLVKSERIADLLAFNQEDQTQNDKQLILTNLLNSDAAVSAIISAGHLKELNQAISACDDRTRDRLFQKLMVRQSYLELVIKQGDIATLLATLSKQPAHERSQTALKLAEQLEGKDLSNEPRIALLFWEVAVKPKASYYEQRLAQKLLSLSWFRRQVIEINNRDDGFTRLVRATPPDYMNRVLSSALSSNLFADILENDQIPFLETLISGLSERQRSGILSGRIAHSSSLRNWLAKEGNLDVFLQRIDGFRSPALKISFAGHILCNHSVVNNDNQKQIATYLLELGSKQEPEFAARLCMRMLGISHLQKQALASPMMDSLLQQLEPDDRSPEFLIQLSQQYSALGALANKGHARKVIDAMLSVKDNNYRPAILRYMLCLTMLERKMTDEEVRSSIDLLFSDPKHKIQLQSMISSACVVRLIELGYFDKLHQFARTTSTSAQSTPYIWLFLTNQAVVKKMRDEGRSSKPLIDVLLQTGNRYRIRYCLQSLVSSTAFEWVVDEYGWKRIETVANRLPIRDKQNVYSSMVNSSFVQQYCIKKRDLSVLASVLPSSNSPDTYRRNLCTNMVYQTGFKEALADSNFANHYAGLITDVTDLNQQKMMLDMLRRNSSVMKVVRASKPNELSKLLSN